MMMRPGFLSRRAFFGAAAALAAPHLPVAAAQSQSRRPSAVPREVAAGLWMIEGETGGFARENGGAIVNIALLETRDGAVVIDTGSTAAMGAEIRAFADQRLGGVAQVLITHHHPDHWFGNSAFADRPILALPETAARCRRFAQDFAEALYAILGPAMAGTRAVFPTAEIGAGDLELGGRRLRLMALAGHTQADLALTDLGSGVLIAGDLVFLGRAPSLPDADIEAWLGALDHLGALGAEFVLPGHGAFHRGHQGIRETRDFLLAIRGRLALAAHSGLSPVEAMAAGPVPEYAGLGAQPGEYLRSVAQRWSGFEQEALPLVGGI